MKIATQASGTHGFRVYKDGVYAGTVQEHPDGFNVCGRDPRTRWARPADAALACVGYAAECGQFRL